ncbi:hypothetical protein EZS27_023453, partial [termite gut metagenome]
MKKIVFALAFVAGLFSCTDNLEVVPIGQLMGGNFPATANDAIALTNAIYQPNIGISTSLGYMIDLSTETTISGEAQFNDGGSLLGVLAAASTNSYINSVWTAFYTGITSANDVIERVGELNTVSESLKKRLIGEAQFLRA